MINPNMGTKTQNAVVSVWFIRPWIRNLKKKRIQQRIICNVQNLRQNTNKSQIKSKIGILRSSTLVLLISLTF